MGNSRRAIMVALCLGVVGCGSQAQFDRNQESINAQLAVANSAAPSGSGVPRRDPAPRAELPR